MKFKTFHLGLLSFILLFSFFFTNPFSSSQALTKNQSDNEESVKLHSEITDSTNQEKVVFSYKPDYKDLSNFLGVTEEKYFELRKSYSMLEIAQKQKISEEDLFKYLVNKRFEALDSHFQLGKIDHWFIMNYTLHLKEDVKWEMTAKSISQ